MSNTFYKLDKKAYFEQNKANTDIYNKIQSIISEINIYKDIYSNVGIEVLGPMLLGYTLWVKKMTDQESINKICFLSREGLILKKAYIEMYGVDCNKQLTYINVSRLSVCRALASKSNSYEDIIEIFSGLLHGVEKISELMELLNPTSVMQYYKKYNLSPSDNIESIDNKIIFSFIKETSYEFFVEQFDCLRTYLEENKVNEGKVAICDIGWAGTMQLMLQSCCPDVEYKGYYFALSSFHYSRGYSELKKFGYWCKENEWKDKGQILRFSISAIESLFLSSEGTTLFYEKVNNKVIPIKENTVETLYKNKKKVQEAALTFVKKWKENNLNFFDYIDPDISMLGYINFAVYPSLKTLSFFINDNFIDGVKQYSFLPNHNIIFYLLHPHEFKNELETNRAKIIWFKGLLRLPLPYYRVLRFLTLQLGMKSEYRKKYKIEENPM